MRSLVPFVLALLACCFPSLASAQFDKRFLPPEIKKTRVGFQVHTQDQEFAAYKVGLWVPIYVEVFGGTDGVAPNPDRPPHLEIETTDSDDVGTRVRLPVAVEPMQTRLFMTYIKTGHMARNSNDVNVKLHVNQREFTLRDNPQSSTINVDSHLYLSLGSRLVDFHRAILKMGQGQNPKEEELDFRFNFDRARYAVFETELERLPDAWFGYNSVDLMILSTENRKFLTGLGNQPERLKAIALWVRRGGRLVVPIARHNQDAVAALLNNEVAWQPPIPVVPPRVPGNLQYNRLSDVERWGGVRGEPFQHDDPKNALVKLPIPVATLDPGNVAAGDWDVQATSGADNRPLITRVRYGLGQITYLAFSLEDSAFFAWRGKEQFLKKLAENLAPRMLVEQNNPNRGMGRQQEFPDDLTTQLLGPAGLDNFDIKVIPFGYVALFIVLYILVVGPLDFFLLKYVFKRLEWTWITFPTVVIAVSVIAYFAAYALKGRDMKINKIDLVDFDLRTSLDEKRQPKDVHAYGQSFFTILSPRIQNYTIGLEPNPEFWGEKPGKILSADLMSWMGRPSDGMNAMGRGSSSGFFRKPYDFSHDFSGLIGVPIPVWTTKAFSASWEQPLLKPPFVVDLIYHQKEIQGKDLVTGTLENHLGVDLVDVWLIYNNRCYSLEDGLKSVQLGAAPRAFAISPQNASDVKTWVNQTNMKDDVPLENRFNPTSSIKQILFHESFDISARGRNHLLRPLDLGWRLKEEQLTRNDRSTREAILFGRVRFANGSAQTITNDAKSPLATKLWLGELPDVGNVAKAPPPVVGNLNQCTYIRAILPVRAADE